MRAALPARQRQHANQRNSRYAAHRGPAKLPAALVELSVPPGAVGDGRGTAQLTDQASTPASRTRTRPSTAGRTTSTTTSASPPRVRTLRLAARYCICHVKPAVSRLTCGCSSSWPTDRSAPAAGHSDGTISVVRGYSGCACDFPTCAHPGLWACMLHVYRL